MYNSYLPVIAVVLALAGCEQQGAQQQRTDSATTGDYIAAPTAAPPPPIAFEAGGSEFRSDEATGSSSADTADIKSMEAAGHAGMLLAYRYSASLQLPARNLRPAIEAHRTQCSAAGQDVCQVLGSSITEYGEDNISASLYIRALPDWLATFRGMLEVDARTADGRVVSSNVQSEDLTRVFVDTEAQLRAKRTLRDRLEKLLASQSGDIGDLLAVERELARVQSELDAAQSNLEIIHKRVDMSTLDLSYQSAPAAISQSAFAPIAGAFNSFMAIFSRAVALIIKLIAGLMPFILLGAPFVWLLRRWWRRRRAGKVVDGD
jgi:cytidylate kinase